MTLDTIRKHCARKGITLTGLEKAVGLAPATILKWQGKNPGVENVKLVADYFGCTVDDLLRPAGEKESDERQTGIADGGGK